MISNLHWSSKGLIDYSLSILIGTSQNVPAFLFRNCQLILAKL